MEKAETSINRVMVNIGGGLECRACLRIIWEKSASFHIFEKWNPPWDGMANNIAEDLARLANIQILETDKHSKIICESCWQMLLCACNFTTTVRNSDITLKQRNSLVSEELDTASERVWPKPIQVDRTIHNSYDNVMDVEIKQEVLSEDEYGTANGVYDCSKEQDLANLDIKIEPEEIQQPSLPIQVVVNGSVEYNEIVSKQEKLMNGNAKSDEDDIKPTIKDEPLSENEDVDGIHPDLPLECMLCTKTFNSVTGLKAHVIAQHSYKSVKRKTDNSISPEKKKSKYICGICRRNFTTRTDLMVHETCHNKSVCYVCNESFDTFHELTAHRRTCKAIPNNEVAKLKTLDDVLRPQQQQDQEKVDELKCTLCSETFTDSYYMKIHQEVHHSIMSSQSDVVTGESMVVETLENIFED